MLEFKFTEFVLRICARIQVYSIRIENILLEFKFIEFAYKKHCLLPNYIYLASILLGEMVVKELEVLTRNEHHLP